MPADTELAFLLDEDDITKTKAPHFTPLTSTALVKDVFGCEPMIGIGCAQIQHLKIGNGEATRSRSGDGATGSYPNKKAGPTQREIDGMTGRRAKTIG
jgi:hypothetical protein